MKKINLDEVIQNHILLGEIVRSIKRIWIAFRIWRIDCTYVSLNAHLTMYDESMKALQHDASQRRVALMIRRQELRSSMKKLEDF